MNLYYKIWVDGLRKLKSIPANRSMWKFYAMIFISMAMAINFMLIIAILERNVFRTNFYHLEFDFFPELKLNSFLSFFILFLGPCVLINYFLIFRKKRYELLFKKYTVNYNGKLCVAYIMTSYFLPFILLIIGYVINKI
jgi:hypothetical protein